MPKLFANIRIAPSTEAAEFMFGKDCVKKNEASLLHNGVDLSVYRYDEMKRNEIRQEFNIEAGTLLVGHVGRFNEQKNHTFLLKIFKKIYGVNSNAKLLLVGDGNLKEEIRNKALEMGIGDSIIFTGIRSDIPAMLSAMDVLVMPSFYEGMPNTVIEAQATGLRCVISDTITKEADVTGLVHYLSLNATDVEWAETTISQAKFPRKNTAEDFCINEYDIENVANKFISLMGMEESCCKLK